MAKARTKSRLDSAFSRPARSSRLAVLSVAMIMGIGLMAGFKNVWTAYAADEEVIDLMGEDGVTFVSDNEPEVRAFPALPSNPKLRRALSKLSSVPAAAQKERIVAANKSDDEDEATVLPFSMKLPPAKPISLGAAAPLAQK